MDIEILVKKLPHVQRWIDSLIEQQRSHARPVVSLGFGRLKEWFAPDTLSKAFMVEIDKVPTPPLTALGLHEFSDFEQMDADGITYRDVYFLNRQRADDESLHFHELVHVVQWQLLGPEQFILTYALGHALCGGYQNNPLEQIAYDLQGRFERFEPPLSVEPVVKHHLEQTAAVLFGSIAR